LEELKIEKMTKELFGEMRNCTKEESNAINKVFKSKSKSVIGKDGKPINFNNIDEE